MLSVILNMAMKRKGGYLRRAGVKRRRMLRRSTRYRMVRNVRSIVPAITVKRVFHLQQWVPSSVTLTDYWRQHFFTMAQVPQFAEYAAVFDQYKIVSAKFTFIPNYTGYDGSNTTDVTLPGITNQTVAYITRCYDNRSTTVAAGAYSSGTYNAFLEQGKVTSQRQLIRPVSLYNKCTILGEYIGGTANDMFTKAKWLPTTRLDVAHYVGSTFITDNNFTGVFNVGINVVVTAYIKFRNQK